MAKIPSWVMTPYQKRDVGKLMEGYQTQTDPYYEASALRMRRAIQRQLGSQTRQLGESFAGRGLAGPGLMGRARERLGAESVRSLGEGMGGLQSERMRMAIQRRTGLEDIESRRGYETWTRGQQRAFDWDRWEREMAARERAQRMQAWQQGIGTLVEGALPFLGGGLGKAGAGKTPSPEDALSYYLG